MHYHTAQVIQLLFWYAWFRQTQALVSTAIPSFSPYLFPLCLCSIVSRLKGENLTRIKTLEITFGFTSVMIVILCNRLAAS